MIRKQFILLALIFSGTSAAQDHFLAAGLGYDTLSGDYSDWQHQYVRGNYEVTEQLAVSGSLVRFDRFNTSDIQYQTNVTYRTTERLTVSTWASYTPNAVFRPARSYGAQLYTAHDYSGGLAVGYQYQDWGQTDSQQWYLEPDYYFSDFRLAWRISLNQPDAAGSSLSHQVTGSWYYTDLSRVSLIVATGKETEGIRGQALVTDVDSIALFGRHHLNGQWAIEYGASHTRQGDFYNRTGVELGVLYRF